MRPSSKAEASVQSFTPRNEKYTLWEVEPGVTRSKTITLNLSMNVLILMKKKKTIV